MTGCERIRVALSARMDGEDPGLGGLDDHLASCAECRTWLATASQVTRAVRVQAVEVPDLTARILAAVHTDQSRSQDSRVASRRRILQIALAISAAVQLALAIPALFGGPDVHLSREAASFDIALAVGFALAAWQPGRARAFVPVAFVLAGCLTITSAFDIAGGMTLFAHEVTHVAALAQAFILLALSRGSAATATPRQRQAVTP